MHRDALRSSKCEAALCAESEVLNFPLTRCQELLPKRAGANANTNTNTSVEEKVARERRAYNVNATLSTAGSVSHRTGALCTGENRSSVAGLSRITSVERIPLFYPVE